MSKRAIGTNPIAVVIGNGYGDEGKGLLVDALSDKDTTVIRFNGGAQAGHTVVLKDGRRHVFHSFGSGTLQGAKTFLSRFMCVDPIAVCREREQLRDECDVYDVSLVVDYAAPITTPFEWLRNQAREKARGDARHGSCGFGVGETMARHEETPHRLYAIDLLNPMLRDKLLSIRAYHHDLPLQTSESIDSKREEEAIELFLSCAEQFCNDYSFETFDADCELDTSNLVFEGAQGLLLDREIGFFPYVTRAKTGLFNAAQLLGSLMKYNPPDIYFARRWYMTRHGPGPFRGEVETSASLGCGDLRDDTNQWNEWQRSFRFGRPDPKLLDWAIERALAEVPNHQLGSTMKKVVTWMDTWPEEVPSVLAADGSTLNRRAVLDSCDYASFGPHRDDLRACT